MIALALSLAVSGAGVQQPAPSFDHGPFCQQMLEAAGSEDVRPGTVMDRWTVHGGITVDCDHRFVVVRTLRSRPVTKGWLKTEEQLWVDDICGHPGVAEATSNGWKLKASILVDGRLVAVFEARCRSGE